MRLLWPGCHYLSGISIPKIKAGLDFQRDNAERLFLGRVKPLEALKQLADGNPRSDGVHTLGAKPVPLIWNSPMLGKPP